MAAPDHQGTDPFGFDGVENYDGGGTNWGTKRGPVDDEEGEVSETRGRGRLPGFRMSNEHRVKIQNSNILNALIEHVEGLREMSATQVSAGLGLLKKIMPDLAATADLGDDGELKPVNRMTDAELEAIISGGGDGAIEAPKSPRELN